MMALSHFGEPDGFVTATPECHAAATNAMSVIDESEGHL